MRIIVDGNDGTGKSTICRQIQKELGITSYVHLSYKDPTDFDFYYNIFKKQDVIFDRSFMDEPIYADVLGRISKLSDNEVIKLHEHIQNMPKTKIIICVSDNNLYDEDEDVRIIENRKKIDTNFLNIAKKYNYFLYNMNKNNFNELIKYLND